MRRAMPSISRKIPVLGPLVRAGNRRRLRQMLDKLDDVQIASQLDNLDLSDQLAVLRVLTVERRSAVVGAMRFEAAADVISALAPEEAASVVDSLETDDAVDILGRIDAEQLDQILAKLDKDDAEEIEQLLAYDESTAGGLMSPEFLSVSPDATVAEALATIQSAEEIPEAAFYVYVVDRRDHLVGVCSLRMLVTSRPIQRIADIMLTELITISVNTDQEEVAELVSRYDLVAVPVVDNQRRMLGVIEVDDVLDVIREEATEDILKMAGAGEELSDARSFGSAFQSRWRWLGAAALGGMFVATSLAGFHHALAETPALALFMPVVAGMGGNVGIQSSTIVVRGLAVGYLETFHVRRLIAREVALGSTLGLLYGVVIASSSWWLSEGTDPLRLGIVVAGGTAGSMTIASAMGTCTPLLLDRLGVDPAVATGPFVTTTVDVMGLLFYFWLSSVLLGVG